MGYKNKFHSDSLKKAIQELTGGQSLAVAGAVLCQSQTALEHLVEESVVEETKAIIPSNIDPTLCLKSAACNRGVGSNFEVERPLGGGGGGGGVSRKNAKIYMETCQPQMRQLVQTL